MRFVKNKKGDVGFTLTWIVAFTIVFFIMIGFLVIVTGMVNTKTANGLSIFHIENSRDKLLDQGELNAILNSNVEFEGKQTSVKNLIILWYISEGERKVQVREEVNTNLKSLFDSLIASDTKGCYSYTIYDSRKPSEFFWVSNIKATKALTLDPPEETLVIIPFNSNDKITIKFYYGTC